MLLLFTHFSPRKPARSSKWSGLDNRTYTLGFRRYRLNHTNDNNTTRLVIVCSRMHRHCRIMCHVRSRRRSKMCTDRARITAGNLHCPWTLGSFRRFNRITRPTLIPQTGTRFDSRLFGNAVFPVPKRCHSRRFRTTLLPPLLSNHKTYFLHIIGRVAIKLFGWNRIGYKTFQLLTSDSRPKPTCQSMSTLLGSIWPIQSRSLRSFVLNEKVKYVKSRTRRFSGFRWQCHFCTFTIIITVQIVTDERCAGNKIEQCCL